MAFATGAQKHHSPYLDVAFHVRSVLPSSAACARVCDLFSVESTFGDMYCVESTINLDKKLIKRPTSKPRGSA